MGNFVGLRVRFSPRSGFRRVMELLKGRASENVRCTPTRSMHLYPHFYRGYTPSVTEDIFLILTTEYISPGVCTYTKYNACTIYEYNCVLGGKFLVPRRARRGTRVNSRHRLPECWRVTHTHTTNPPPQRESTHLEVALPNVDSS